MSGKRISIRARRAVSGYLFILPFIIGFLCFMLLPLHSYAFGGSFLTVDLLGCIIILATTVYSGVEYFIVNKAALDLKS